jgi:hypothetical protein
MLLLLLLQAGEYSTVSMRLVLFKQKWKVTVVLFDLLAYGHACFSRSFDLIKRGRVNAGCGVHLVASHQLVLPAQFMDWRCTFTEPRVSRSVVGTLLTLLYPVLTARRLMLMKYRVPSIGPEVLHVGSSLHCPKPQSVSLFDRERHSPTRTCTVQQETQTQASLGFAVRKPWMFSFLFF